MQTILTPCRVPWSISPSMSGLTLTHCETDVQPECTVVFGAGRLQNDDKTDMRRIEITFDGCYYARTGPHSDYDDIEAVGYRVVPEQQDPMDEYWSRLAASWRATGICPRSGFYVAIQSEWLTCLPAEFRKDCHHYVIDGRDGYVELTARRFRWREWLWLSTHRDEVPLESGPIAEGEGAA